MGPGSTLSVSQLTLGPPSLASSRELLSAQWAVNSCSADATHLARRGADAEAPHLSHQMRSGGLCEVNLRKNKQLDKTRGNSGSSAWQQITPQDWSLNGVTEETVIARKSQVDGKLKVLRTR